MEGESRRISEIEERLAKATPWPWKTIGLSISGPKYPRSRYPDKTIHIASVSSGINRVDGSYADDGSEIDMAGDGFSDAKFIANAPDDIRFLIDALTEAQTAAKNALIALRGVEEDRDLWKRRAEAMK